MLEQLEICWILIKVTLQTLRIEDFGLEFRRPSFSNDSPCYASRHILHTISESLHFAQIKIQWGWLSSLIEWLLCRVFVHLWRKGTSGRCPNSLGLLLLHNVQHLGLFRRFDLHKTEGDSFGTTPGRTTNPMCVGLWVDGKVHVDDKGNVLEVQTPRNTVLCIMFLLPCLGGTFFLRVVIVTIVSVALVFLFVSLVGFPRSIRAIVGRNQIVKVAYIELINNVQSTSQGQFRVQHSRSNVEMLQKEL
mmetsp:Transcript_24994/g.58209  ORF Transcript_24994/g.58209 Transcript_24994/m.58209 type:complete len:247 (+) Transcript_24994:751-1491(+)